MEQINTKIKKIIFKNEQNFIIANTEANIIIKGSVLEVPEVLVGQMIVFTGEWIESNKYGKQFSFSAYEIKTDYVFFFLTTMVKGLTKKAASEISKRFGNNFKEVIEKTPEKLLTVKGVGDIKLKKITESYHKNKHLKSLADFLLPHGITPNAIIKIYSQFKENSIPELQKNPYILTLVKGIAFKKADVIAIKLGIKESDINRVKASVLFAFEEYIGDGHTLIQKNQIVGLCIDVLKTETYEPNEEIIMEALELLITDGIMSKFNLPHNQDPNGIRTMYTTKKLLEMEMYIHKFFKNNANEKIGKPIISNIESYITSEENRVGFQFNDNQKAIIKLANEGYRIIALGGYGGSGKTTSAQSILRIYENVCGDGEIVCCALSGVAANRAKTVTGYPAYTIHSLLGFGASGFTFHSGNKLTQKVILLDEASMVDTYLFYSLLQAIDPLVTMLIIVGDPSQLQSVGAGDIYRNVLDKQLCHNVILDKVYRQKEEQVINIFAQSIRQAQTPKDPYVNNYDDFKFISLYEYESQKTQLATIQEIKNIAFLHMRKIALEYLEKQEYKTIDGLADSDLLEIAIRASWGKGAWKYITNFQTITAMNKNLLGVENLNKELQSVFNPFPRESDLKIGDKIFRERDKVIHLKNENMSVIDENTYKTELSKDLNNFDNLENIFETRVFNGQFGIILKIQEDRVAVYYPNEKYICIYEKKDFSEGLIAHSYAISIHKSQGSQFDNVVIPMSMSHYIMLNNQLMYTAVTRAKDMLYLVGEKKAFVRACTNAQTTKRNTILEKL